MYILLCSLYLSKNLQHTCTSIERPILRPIVPNHFVGFLKRHRGMEKSLGDTEVSWLLAKLEFYSVLQLRWKIIFPFLAKSRAHTHTLYGSVLLISSHFEHYGSVSVARAQYICIGHGARSRFRSVRSEMKSTVCAWALRMGTRLCKEWENNFPMQLQYSGFQLRSKIS